MASWKRELLRALLKPESNGARNVLFNKITLIFVFEWIEIAAFGTVAQR